MRNGIILFLCALSISAKAQLPCAALLADGITPQSQAVRQNIEIRDLRTFGQAMTEGVLLRPEQTDLFEIYREIFFGDPNTAVNDATLKTVTDLLKNHPELQKLPFREYEVETVRKAYETPESLAKYLKSQNGNAGQVRSNLFQVEANLGFWKKLVGFEDSPMSGNLSKDQRRQLQDQQKTRFLRYLDRIISKENRVFLKDEKVDYRLKVKTLYGLLKRMSDHMERRGRNTKQLRQAMVDLIATTGFNNHATQELLKSKNALDTIEGLNKILDERNEMAMELGFAGHFKEMLQNLRIDSPSLSIRAEDETKFIVELEREVLSGSFQTLPSEKIRVRSLSIQEAPFRSCLGGSDCSSRTYFSKALDPNFNYFTMTDSDNRSSGHVTIVLGVAKDQAGQNHKVAFVDKLQNVPNQMIPLFLEAVRLSLREQGYLLGVPEDVGDESGLSNSATIRHFFANDVLPSLRTSQLTDFTPHQNQYKFANGFSRAYLRPSLSLRLYELKDSLEDVEIRPGKRYGPGLAEATLNRNKLVEDLMRFRESSNEQDVLKYIASSQIMDGLEKLGLFTQKEFLNDLMKISINPARSFSVRKKAFFEILLVTSRADATIFPDYQESRFSDAEKSQMNSEIKQWKSSSDKKKKQFANGIDEMWFKAARDGNETLADALPSLRLVEINLDLFSNFLNIPYSTDHARIHSFFLSHPSQRGSQASLAVLSKLTDLLWKSPEGQAWFAHHPESLRLLKSHNRQLTDHIVVQNWKIFDFNLEKADDRQILMRVVAQTESIEKLQDVIYLKIRKNTPDAQIAFVSELATSSICSLFCRELLTSLFIHSGQLGLQYDTSVFKREGHNLPIDNSVRTAVLRTSNLSESELSSLVYLKTPKSASAADFLKMLRILESKFNIFGQNLADLPILNLAEKIDLFTQMEKIADSDLKTNSKIDLDLTISRLTQRLISSFIGDTRSPYSFNQLAEKIRKVHFPQLDEESVLGLYKRRDMKNSSGYTVLNPYVVAILQTQKHLPTGVFEDIVRLSKSTGRTDVYQILKDYRPSWSEISYLIGKFLADLQLKSTEGDHNMTEAFYIPKFEPPILSERLLKGQEWTDQIYERIASLWEYATKGWLMAYICSAPDLPVSWQKNLIKDIVSGETGRMGRALRIISSQRHSVPALEQLFQSEIEKKKPFSSEKLYLILSNLIQDEGRSRGVNFSKQMWFWLFSRLKLNVPASAVADTTQGKKWTNEWVITVGFELVKWGSNAPNSVYDRLFRWVKEDPLVGEKMMSLLLQRQKLPAQILARLPEEGSALYTKMDEIDQLKLNKLRRNLERAPVSR